MSQKRRASYRTIVEHKELTSYFQPIVSIGEAKVFAYEALCRLTGEHVFEDIEQFFTYAEEQEDIFTLDMLCRESALRCAERLGAGESDALFFVNICPSTLLNPFHSIGSTEAFCQHYGISKDRVVLEVTERESVTNYQRFADVISHYRAEGFKIAIDDFGAGYGGLKMLSLLEPDFVKIDQHFFRDQSRSRINYNLIDAVFTACHRIGIDVIAEGIETEEELEVCREIGIELVQGYYLGRPKPSLNCSLAHLQDVGDCSADISINSSHNIGALARYVTPFSRNSSVLDVVEFFLTHPEQFSLPILDGVRLCGVLNRSRFLEQHMSRCLDAVDNAYCEQPIFHMLEDKFLNFAHYISFEDVAKKVLDRSVLCVYDDVAVSCRGRYLGLVSVSDLLAAITQNSVDFSAQPEGITNLPGRAFVMRQLSHLLLSSCHFDIAYINIKNFKQYNLRYGFEAGNSVLLAFAEILRKHVKRWGQYGNCCFAAHLAGDNFVFLARPRDTLQAMQQIVEDFHALHARLHEPKECVQEFYSLQDREWSLLSLAVGIVSTSLHGVDAIEQLAPLAEDLLARAKKKTGSAIVRERRQS